MFMHKVKNHNIIKIFEKCFKITFNNYNKKSSNTNFYKNKMCHIIPRSTVVEFRSAKGTSRSTTFSLSLLLLNTR